MDAWFAPDPDPFAFFVELQPLIMASTPASSEANHTKTLASAIIALDFTLTLRQWPQNKNCPPS
jgi:hypothetical protein